MTVTADPRDHVDELAAAYALGALDPTEAVGVERHLHGCADCARLVADVRGTVGLLAFSARPETPPPAVKAALFARVEHAQQAATAASGAAARRRAARFARAKTPALAANPWAPPTEPPAPSGQRPIGLPHPRSRWARIAGPIATVPLLLALALVGGWSMRLQDQVASRDAQVRDLQLRASAMGAALGADQDGMVEYPLHRGPAAGEEAGGTLFVDVDENDATLMAWGLADPGERRGYFVYLRRGSDLVQAGQVRVTADGNGTATLDLVDSIASYKSVHVKAVPLGVGGGNPDGIGAVADTGSSWAGAVTKDDALSAEIGPSVGSPSEETGGGMSAD